MEKTLFQLFIVGLLFILESKSRILGANDINDSENQVEIINSVLKNQVNDLIKLIGDDDKPIDAAKWDFIGDEMIRNADVSEETKRMVRQVKKERPGVFWTVFRVIFETVGDARSAIGQLNELVAKDLPVEVPTSKPPVTSPPVNGTTTPTPFKLTRNLLESLVRRNIAGLVRLFNVEWKDAINQSEKSIRNFQRELSKSAAPFLADNPDV